MCCSASQLLYLGKGYFFSWWNVLDFASLVAVLAVGIMRGNAAVGGH